MTTYLIQQKMVTVGITPLDIDDEVNINLYKIFNKMIC